MFINVCQSDKITKATSKKLEGGSQWDVPYRWVWRLPYAPPRSLLYPYGRSWASAPRRG